MDLKEESSGPLDLVSSSAQKTDVCSVTGTGTHKQASDDAAGTTNFYETSQGNVSEDATTNTRLFEPNFVQVKQEPPEELCVADIPYQSSVDNDTTKDGGVCPPKEEIPNEVRDFSNEYAYNSSVGEAPLNLCSKVYIKEEEDLSSQDDILSEDSDDESVKPIEQDFSSHYTVKRDEPPKTPVPTHDGLFVKEEACARPRFESEYVPQYSSAPRTPGPTHGMFTNEEPFARPSFESVYMPQYTCAPRTPGPTHAVFTKEETFARPSFESVYVPQYSCAPRTPGPTHAVFIKEEACEPASLESEAMSQNSVADENTFGNHFLTQCLEPRQPQYQYANGLSAENECDSSLDLSELGLQTMQAEQMDTDNDDLSDNEANHSRLPTRGNRENTERRPTLKNSPSGGLAPVDLADDELNDSADSEDFSGSDSYDVNYEFPESSSEEDEEDPPTLNHAADGCGRATDSASGDVNSCKYDGTEDSKCEWRNVGEYKKTCSNFRDYSPNSIINFQLVHPQPVDIFYHFVTDELWECMVRETNRSAEQYKASCAGKPSALYLPWTDTTVAEMKQFVGVMMTMGLVPLPTLDAYWSKDKLYNTKFISSVMSRDRFLLLKKFWSFENNDTVKVNGIDDLIKIRNFVYKLNLSFLNSLTPGKDLVIDETEIPWREKVFFQRYIPSKNHKDCVTLYKLCTEDGFTLKVLVDIGKSTGKSSATHSFEIVMELMDGIFENETKVFTGFLDKGRHLYMDDFYSGIILAEKLLERKTYLCGYVRPNRKGVSCAIMQDINEGEYKIKECQHGTKVIRWKDHLMISTFPDHDTAVVSSGKVNRKGQPILKPQVVLNYNSARKDVEFISDEMSAYPFCLKVSLKWYKKVVLELITETCVINSWILHRMMSGQQIKLHRFREYIAQSLMAAGRVPVSPARKRSHSLSKVDGYSRKTRRRCTVCYQHNRRTMCAKEAARKTRQVSLYCKDCPNKPFMCLPCFSCVHNL